MKLQCIHRIECILNSAHRFTIRYFSNLEKGTNTCAIWSKNEWRFLLPSKEPMGLLGLSQFQQLSKLGKMEKEHSGGVRLSDLVYRDMAANYFEELENGH